MALSGGRETALIGPGRSEFDAQRYAEANGLAFFEPAFTVDDGRGPIWRFSCRALQPNGRCGRYETRPDLCRRFEPLQDGLCVHFGGTEAGDASVGLPQ